MRDLGNRGMGQVTVQQILQSGYAAFEQCHPLPAYVRKAVWALLACRAARLGGHMQACPEGHGERVWYHSCRHRLCPPCAWLQVERWLVRQKARLLACDHYHVFFTLPDELRGLWLANSTVMPQLLFARVWETLDELLRDEPYLGARVGIIATLHTWSQTLLCHPHLHGLVTGGGLTDEGQWRVVRTGFLLPVRVVMAVFRGKLLAALRQRVVHGQLTLPEGRNGQQMANLLNQLGRMKAWSSARLHWRDPALPDSTTAPGAGGGCGVPSGAGTLPRSLREGCARTPRTAWPGPRQQGTRRRSPSSARYAPSDLLRSASRRGLSGRSGAGINSRDRWFATRCAGRPTRR
jgi:Transposase zinc-binding domain/Putative transposase